MRPHAGAVEERHPKLDPTLLHQVEQALPDTQASPADEGLSGPHQGPSSVGTARHLAPFSCRQRMASSVRRRSCGGVLPLGRHCSTSSSSIAHCVSVSMAPPQTGRAKRLQAQRVQVITGRSSSEACDETDCSPQPTERSVRSRLTC
jgi:hypothetical protein